MQVGSVLFTVDAFVGLKMAAKDRVADVPRWVQCLAIGAARRSVHQEHAARRTRAPIRSQLRAMEAELAIPGAARDEVARGLVLDVLCAGLSGDSDDAGESGEQQKLAPGGH